MNKEKMIKVILHKRDIMMLIESTESYIDKLKAGHCDLAVKEFKSILDELKEQGGFNE